ncbi:hypothetical protein AWR36_010925 [Microbulbifer flavimaris]|uniref:Aminoglycoside phosphotransferase domain-containing protein n=1 Tax=Microbulbifer flavimaris TaxID=1781068 RepID=A0ABX4HZK4_9GAMM|nr:MULTISPECIES: hypothetical protein [Microbulbifer]KUJ83044.1 hypothetical protein AVO43_10905 [Microbulbifer sp. ZGT114]PCO05228.1 hypothetical protein AWR36_010925 [Microbulbifer flavimaris]
MTVTLSPTPSNQPDLEEKTRFLLDPASYGGTTGQVTLVETHMARVFLTDDHAYKMKKPVRSSYLDFSSLDKRYGVCSEELRLNRRLTDDVYLELTALRMQPGGALVLDGEGGLVVEWLVKMRRLPDRDCLVKRIDTVTETELTPLLRRLCDFYRHSEPLQMTGEQYLAHLRRQIGALWRQLLLPGLELDPRMVNPLASGLLQFVDSNTDLFARRAEGGRILEGHGDLRPEHCFLTTPPQIIDCLEFDRDLRCVDPVDEAGYLALECEMLGRADLSEFILTIYGRECDDEPPEKLSCFYRAYRALLRGQLAGAHLLDGDIAEPEKWRQKTDRYLAAASDYANRL